MIDWFYIISVTFPIIILSILVLLLNKRIIECEQRSLKLLDLIMISNNRIALTEANQKIFYELHKRNS